MAQALERVYGDRIEEQVELLALHWERAGELEESYARLADWPRHRISALTGAGCVGP